VLESFGWQHGVYLGATLASETTAAATGAVGVVRRDPMAMLPFCGYDMGEYFGHWLKMHDRISRPPKLAMVNWFRKRADGKFLWPGFGENLRVVKWVLDRVEGKIGATQTPVGLLPMPDDFDLEGLDDRAAALAALAVDLDEWRSEVGLQDELFQKLSRTMPRELVRERENLRDRLAGRAGAGGRPEAPATT
jgi:phosphoenolpyruvate carboxykinase (GTP)